MSDDAPPVVPFSEVRRRREVYSPLRAPKPPQEFASLHDYHEARCVSTGEEPQTTANCGFESVKRLHR